MEVSGEDIHALGGQPFVPDPYFADPAIYSQFILTATAPRTRKKRGPPKPKRHIKMVKGLDKWDIVEFIRKIPIKGLDVGNFFDIAPNARMSMVKSL